MHFDLLIAVGFIAAVSGIAFWAGRRLSLSVYHRKPLLLVECIVFSLVFAFGYANQLSWANAFSTPAVLCWSNWLPVLLAFSAGLASQAAAVRQPLRRVCAATMALIAFSFLMLPVARPHVFPLQLAQQADWDDGICLQSHEASCGPSAAATLLHHSNSIRSPFPSYDKAEAYMAEACLTSSQGTSSLGLVRGLRLAIHGTNQQVAVANTNPRQWTRYRQLPNIAIVRFANPSGNSMSSSPVRRLLGTDGDGHAVVIHSRTADGKWKIADPATGWQIWDDQYLRSIFSGEAIYLEEANNGDQHRIIRLAKDFENVSAAEAVEQN